MRVAAGQQARLGFEVLSIRHADCLRVELMSQLVRLGCVRLIGALRERVGMMEDGKVGGKECKSGENRCE